MSSTGGDQVTEPQLGIQTSVASTVGRITTPASNPGLQRSLATVGSSLVAVLIAFVICGIVLAITGKDPIAAYEKMFQTGLQGDNLLDMLQRATPLMLSAVAVALGFKMNLFNIGVEGQYLVAAFAAAVIGAQYSIPAPLHIASIFVVAMFVGAAWSSIAAVLKVKRGVNEVISTIMLNSIALAFVQWLFDTWFRDSSTDALNVKTKLLPESAWMPDIVAGRLSWMFVVSIVVVAVYWLVVFKSRFGFRLRASGLNGTAARTAGISAGRMVITAMVLSGAVAGLVGLLSVLSDIHAYGQGVTKGLGFAGIAVALLGRNHPLGIVAAALLFGFLNSTSAVLQLQGIPNSIIDVMQAIIVITVVIVNESTTRWLNRRTARQTAQRLATSTSPTAVAAA